MRMENGKWKEDPNDNCYYIDSIISQPDFAEEQKREKQLSKYNDMQAHNLILLNNAFNYFEQLTKHGFAGKEARKISGLSNELLFRIAFLNNKIINQGK